MTALASEETTHQTQQDTGELPYSPVSTLEARWRAEGSTDRPPTKRVPFKLRGVLEKPVHLGPMTLYTYHDLAKRLPDYLKLERPNTKTTKQGVLRLLSLASFTPGEFEYLVDMDLKRYCFLNQKVPIWRTLQILVESDPRVFA